MALGISSFGLGLALFLADWKLAFLCLFAANLLGTLDGATWEMVRGTLDRKAKVPFGPLLIVGFFADLVHWSRNYPWIISTHMMAKETAYVLY